MEYRISKAAEEQLYCHHTDDRGDFVCCTVCNRTDYLHTLDCPVPGAIELAERVVQAANISQRIALLNSTDLGVKGMQTRILASHLVGPR